MKTNDNEGMDVTLPVGASPSRSDVRMVVRSTETPAALSVSRGESGVDSMMCCMDIGESVISPPVGGDGYQQGSQRVAQVRLDSGVERIIADWGPEQGRRTRFDVCPDRDKPGVDTVDDRGPSMGVGEEYGGRISSILPQVPRGQEVSHLLITRRNPEGASVCTVGWVSWRLGDGSMGCRMEQWCGSGYGAMERIRSAGDVIDCDYDGCIDSDTDSTVVIFR